MIVLRNRSIGSPFLLPLLPSHVHFMAVCFNYLLSLAPQLASFPSFFYLPVWWHRHAFLFSLFFRFYFFLIHFYSSLHGSIVELLATIFYEGAKLSIAA